MVAAHTSNGANLDPTVDAASSAGWRRWLNELSTREQARLAQFGAIVVAGFVAAIGLLYAFVWLADQVLDLETRAIDLGRQVVRGNVERVFG